MRPDAANYEQLLPPDTLAFYRDALAALQEAEVPFLLGGGYAFFVYTAIPRFTKDLDIFLQRKDLEHALTAFEAAGYSTEVTATHWLAKASSGRDFIDIIFNSGNGCCPVDARWFEYATHVQALGTSVKLIPPEETIWQKAFIMERERYDGADVAYLLRACGPTLDWNRLLERFGIHRRVLLAQLILFGYIFPDRRSAIPEWVMDDLIHGVRWEEEEPPRERNTCFGTLLSRQQYDTAVSRDGYQDARLPPVGTMTREQIAAWNAPAEQDATVQK